MNDIMQDCKQMKATLYKLDTPLDKCYLMGNWGLEKYKKNVQIGFVRLETIGDKNVYPTQTWKQ